MLPDGSAGGVSGSGRATGSGWAGPDAVRGAAVRLTAAVMIPAGASVRTMCPIGPANDGFCQVASAPPKSVASTPAGTGDADADDDANGSVSGIGGAEAQAWGEDGPGSAGAASR